MSIGRSLLERDDQFFNLFLEKVDHKVGAILKSITANIMKIGN